MYLEKLVNHSFSEKGSMMRFWWVMCEDADLCYLVHADTAKNAKAKVLTLLKDETKLVSLDRLRKAAAEKHCSPHVMLRAMPCPETLPGVYSLNE